MKLRTLLITTLCLCVLLAFSSGCQQTLRFAASEAQKKIAFQGLLTARKIEAEGTEPHSPAAQQQVQATLAAINYIGPPKNPEISDYPTVLAQAQADAALRPDVNDVFAAAGEGLSIAEQLMALFGVGGLTLGGRSLLKWISLLRTKAKGMEEIVNGNELLQQWLKTNGRTAELEAFKGFQLLSQKGKTPELVATARIPIKRQEIPQVIAPTETGDNKIQS
jgi:hypothetical protein